MVDPSPVMPRPGTAVDFGIERPCGRARSGLGGSMPDELPVLDTLTDITAASLAHHSLPLRELMIARLAARVVVDAPPASYLANAEAAADSGVTADDARQ